MLREVNEGYVRTERQNAITTIEFFHPQSNSLPGVLLGALTDVVNAAGIDPQSRVIVLRSAGEKAFCAGASFNELLAIQTAEEGFAFFSGFANLINAMRKCPQFVIARVQGKCVGGGVGIAAAADYTIAVDGADVRLSELAVGIGPFVIGPAVERKIGRAAYSALAIDAAVWRDAAWANRSGLFAELHRDQPAMDQSIGRLAGTLANSNPEAMAMLKHSFWEGTEGWDKLLPERAAVSGRLVLSDFSRNAIHSFKQKK